MIHVIVNAIAILIYPRPIGPNRSKEETKKIVGETRIYLISKSHPVIIAEKQDREIGNFLNNNNVLSVQNGDNF